MEGAPSLHYLYYTVVLMKGVLTERERCLHQAQALDQVLAAIWRRRVPNTLPHLPIGQQHPGGLVRCPL